MGSRDTHPSHLWLPDEQQSVLEQEGFGQMDITPLLVEGVPFKEMLRLARLKRAAWTSRVDPDTRQIVTKGIGDARLDAAFEHPDHLPVTHDLLRWNRRIRQVVRRIRRKP